MAFNWNDNNVARLTELWTAGHSASVIALELCVTRNTIIGKVHRLGLPGRSTVRKARGVTVRQSRPRLPRAPRPPRARKAKQQPARRTRAELYAMLADAVR